jgi:hypothetical protein
MAKKKAVVVEEVVEVSDEVFETIKDQVEEVVVDEFAKRHPGANPAVIYE